MIKQILQSNKCMASKVIKQTNNHSLTFPYRIVCHQHGVAEKCENGFAHYGVCENGESNKKGERMI